MAKPTAPEAQQHLDRGNKRYNVRKFAEAVDEYIAGAVIESAPVFDFNLGQCYRQLHKYKEAIWHYERFLRRGRPEPERRLLVEDFITQMNAEIARKAATRPRTEPALDASSSARTRPSPVPAITEAASTSIARRADPGPRWYSDRVGWGLVGTGVLGTGAAVLLRWKASSLRTEANASQSEDHRIELRRNANRSSLLGTLVSVGSAAMIVTGAIKLAVSPKPNSTSRTASWSVAISLGRLDVLGQF